MGEEAFQDLQRKIKKGMSEVQRNWFGDRLEAEERMLASDRKALGGQKKITLSVLLIGLILTLWGIWTGTWIMGLALLPGVMSILSFRQSRSRLIERENRIQSMERPEGEVSSDSQRLYDEQLEYRSQWKQRVVLNRPESLNALDLGLMNAMGGAPAEVRKAADWVTRSQHEKGIPYFISEVFRKDPYESPNRESDEGREVNEPDGGCGHMVYLQT